MKSNILIDGETLDALENLNVTNYHDENIVRFRGKKRCGKLITEVIVLMDRRSNTVISHRDVGIEVSQMLPVLVNAYGRHQKTVAIERPEIHLHRALQSELADVFIESALGERANTFLLENHSEHLMLRILRRVREITEKTLPPGARPIRPEDVMILYVEPEGLASKIVELPVTSDGEFARPWMENAETGYARHPFAAIIAMANPRSHATVLLEATVGDETNPLWHRPLAATPPRTPEGIAAMVSALVESCDELHLVDPHFEPEMVKWRHVLERILELVASRKSGPPSRICLNCSSKATLAFFEGKAGAMAAHIPAGVTLTFKRWSEHPDGEKFHNRYLLTDIGELIIGVELNAGSANQTDDVNFMNAVQFLKCWGQLNDACAFDLVDESIAIVGTKR